MELNKLSKPGSKPSKKDNLKQNHPVQSRRNSNIKGQRSSRHVNGNSSGSSQASVSPLRPFSFSMRDFPPKPQPKTSSIKTRSNEKKSRGSQAGPRTVIATGKNLTRVIQQLKVATPPVKKSEMRTGLHSYQAPLKKDKLTSCPIPSKASSSSSSVPSEASSDRDYPTHRIRWNGLRTRKEAVGEICPLCDKDFAWRPNGAADSGSDDPSEYEYESEYDYEDESESETYNQILPIVCVLLCGHVYHDECLKYCAAEEKLSEEEPPCPICASFDDTL